MDVYCASCGEPWDFYYLRHDLIEETEIHEGFKADFDGKLFPVLRKKLAKDKWEFGNLICDVRHCPSCKENDKPKLEIVEMRNALDMVMGDDLDGFVSELNELESF